MLSASAIWTKASEVLKREMNDVSYDAWFRNVKPLAVEDEQTLILMTDDEFYRDTLERLYTDTVERCVNSANGTSLSVKFVLSQLPRAAGAPSSEGADAGRARAQDCPTLITKYTFEKFVTGESNRFAYAAALAVAENPFIAYNPLFIYGGVGLGKTHLVHAIGNYIHEQHPEFKILYISSENFTNDVVQAIAKKERTGLRSKYRDLDVLMIDDIQFIAGKDATEQEFFNTFNDLRNADRQIIITSDKPPKDIPILEERLRTRFGWGLPVDIQPPDFETRMAILQRKVHEENLSIDPYVISFIAEKASSSIRELEGCLNRVVAYAEFAGAPITVSFTESVLKDFIPGSRSQTITMELIMQVVADYYGLSLAEIRSSRRDKRIAFPRQIAMFLSRTMTNSSFPEIGAFYGGRHYSTVMYACDQIEEMVKTSAELSNTIEDIKSRIHSS